jgi:SAM-dependent methyltransferase
MENGLTSRVTHKETAGAAWYLDPAVGEHKRQAHLGLLSRWIGCNGTGRILKTDLFEESNRIDQILFDPLFKARQLLGFDLAHPVARRARDNPAAAGAFLWTSDVLRLPLRSGSIDTVISTSTLDHFRVRSDLTQALREIIRVIRPGGTLVLTMDNPHNPLYWGLRLAGRLGYTPYHLGITASHKQLRKILEENGMEVLDTDCLIHNPRGVSTLLFMAVRRMAGKRADSPLRLLLRCFDGLDRFPTRRWTACFIAVHARKPESSG